MRLVAGGSVAGLAGGGSTAALAAGGRTMRLVAGDSTGPAAGGASTTGLGAGGAWTAGLVAATSSMAGFGCALGGTHGPPVGLGPGLAGLARRGSRGGGFAGAGCVPAAFEGLEAGFGTVDGGTHGPPIALIARFRTGAGRSVVASGLLSTPAPGAGGAFSSARAGAPSTFGSALGSTFAAGGTEPAPAECRMGFPRRRGLPQDLQAVSRSPLCQPQLLQTITSSVR
jgi:hypothetical protein